MAAHLLRSEVIDHLLHKKHCPFPSIPHVIVTVAMVQGRHYQMNQDFIPMPQYCCKCDIAEAAPFAALHPFSLQRQSLGMENRFSFGTCYGCCDLEFIHRLFCYPYTAAVKQTFRSWAQANAQSNMNHDQRAIPQSCLLFSSHHISVQRTLISHSLKLCVAILGTNLVAVQGITSGVFLVVDVLEKHCASTRPNQHTKLGDSHGQ